MEKIRENSLSLQSIENTTSKGTAEPAFLPMRTGEKVTELQYFQADGKSNHTFVSARVPVLTWALFGANLVGKEVPD